MSSSIIHCKYQARHLFPKPMTEHHHRNVRPNQVIRLWNDWLTPRTVDRDDRFRERTVRGVIVIWLAVLLALGVLLIWLNAWPRLSQIFATALFAVPTYLAVRNQY